MREVHLWKPNDTELCGGMVGRIKIYASEGCPFCDRAKSFLKEKGIPFDAIAAPFGSQGWAQMKEETGGGRLPQILVSDQPIGGYSDLVNLEATGGLSRLLGGEDKGWVDTLYDVIIIGGGPAGLSAAVYAARKLLKTLILTQDIGGQVTWAYDVDNYLGFTQMDTAELVTRFEEHVDKYHLEKQVGVNVARLVAAGKIKQVMTSEDEIYFAKTVIIATGKRPKRLGVPGEKELTGMGVAYCSTCDAPLFTGLDVAIAGGGNSALEAALDLSKVANRLYLVSLTPLTGDQVLQDKVRHSNKVEVFVEYEVIRISGESNVEAVEIRSVKGGEVKKLPVSGIFVEIGLRPNSEMVVDTLDVNGVGEILVGAECRTGLSGVFACGDVTSVPFKQIVVAAGEGAKAALSAYTYIMNQR